MTTVTKNNNNNKRKRRKKTRKKRHISDETRTRDLKPNIMVLPQGHEGFLALMLQKACI